MPCSGMKTNFLPLFAQGAFAGACMGSHSLSCMAVSERLSISADFCSQGKEDGTPYSSKVYHTENHSVRKRGTHPHRPAPFSVTLSGLPAG